MQRANVLLRTRGFILISILAAASLIQLFNLVNDYGLLWAKRIFRLADQPAMQRSANYLLGASGAEFMAFLETSTPEDASIIIPPNSVAFSEQNLLQFYLMPRAIISCGCAATNAQNELSQSCIRCLNLPGHSIPAIGDFPPAGILAETKSYFPLEPANNYYRGVFTPVGVAISQPDQQPFAPLRLLLIDLLILGAFFLLGATLTILILRRLRWIEIFIFGLPLGGGIFTWFMFLASWSGITLSMLTVGILYALLLGIVLLLLKHFSDTLGFEPAALYFNVRLQIFRSSPVQILTLLGVLALILFASFLAVGRAYSVYDPIANWSLKAYAIADQGSILAGKDWGGHGLAYPLNLHLLISTFRLADADALPGSKLLFPLFTASLLLGCYRFWRRQTVRAEVALLGVFGLLSVPFIFQHATQGFANLPFTTYLVLGVFAGLEGIYDQRPRPALMAGVLFGLASWTRVEGIGFSLLIVFALFGARFLSGKGNLRAYTMLIPHLIIPGVWILFARTYIGGNTIWEAGPSFVQGFAAEGLQLNALIQIFSHISARFLTPRFWGYVIPLAVMLVFLRRKSFRSADNPKLFALFLSTLLAFFVPIGLFYVASYSRLDFEHMLRINIDRAFFPAVFLLTTLAISTFGTTLISDEPGQG